MRSYDLVFLDTEKKTGIIWIHGGILVENRVSTEEIRIFLERVKMLVSAGKYDFVPRRKNMQALARHGHS